MARSLVIASGPVLSTVALSWSSLLSILCVTGAAQQMSWMYCAHKLRKARVGKLTSHSTVGEGTPFHTYSFDRNIVLSGNCLSGAIENHPAWTTLPLPLYDSFAGTKSRCTTFHINSEWLRALKQAASSLPPSSFTPSDC